MPIPLSTDGFIQGDSPTRQGTETLHRLRSARLARVGCIDAEQADFRFRRSSGCFQEFGAFVRGDHAAFQQVHDLETRLRFVLFLSTSDGMVIDRIGPWKEEQNTDEQKQTVDNIADRIGVGNPKRNDYGKTQEK